MNLPTISAFLIVLFSSPLICLCKCPPRESEALLSLNFSYLGSGEWRKDNDCCDWDCIACDEKKSHVVEISIDARELFVLDGGVMSDAICNLPFLTDITIKYMGTTGTLPPCLGHLRFLRSIDIDNNALSGVIPLTICNLTNLTHLNFGGNQLSGSLPICLNNLSLLSSVSFSSNQLSGQIPYTWGDLPLLSHLDVSFNQLSGSLPTSFAQLSSLTELYAIGNRFDESTPSWALPSSIRKLYLPLTHDLTISETFFHNLTEIDELSLSNCTLNTSTSWIPNIKLSKLELVSCQMEGQIPPWISTQFWLGSLTLANNGLVGEIPSWLWDMTSLSELNLSRNYLYGPIFPNGPIFEMAVVDLSSNALSGRIPSVWPRSDDNSGYAFNLMLNDNVFTGNIPPSLCNSSIRQRINLQNNKLDGIIPRCLLEYGSNIKELNLGGNNLEGRLPHGLAVSSDIRYLGLNQNQLSGTFLPSFANDSNLQVLDIGHNKFTGHLPKSIGNMSSLEVLIMRDNHFNGNILPEISKLENLQIIDLSSNNLSGSIPLNIIFLKAMAVARDEGYVLQISNSDYYADYSSLGGLIMTTKGTELCYPYLWSTFNYIDLSNNQLNGDVPLDIGKLKGLKSLNLSMNNLSGIIPPSMGDMRQLESLDLSSNKLLGNIPSELQSLNYLTYLNLSNNNLSGSIPQGVQMMTFDNTSYSGNPYLEGCPLPKKCKWPSFAPPLPPPPRPEDKDEEEEIPWYQIGVGWSFGAGFVMVVVFLLSISEGLKSKYFKGVDDILKFLFPFLRNRRL